MLDRRAIGHNAMRNIIVMSKSTRFKIFVIVMDDEWTFRAYHFIYSFQYYAIIANNVVRNS